MLPIHTILNASDFSEQSQYATQLAASLARDYGARLVLLHVLVRPTVVFADGIVPPEPEEVKADANQRLNTVAVPDGVRAERRLVEGDAAAEIVRAARAVRADMIVVGTHGRTGLGRWLLGSVAEEVMRDAPCPVVTVRSPFTEAETVPSEVGEAVAVPT